MNINEVMILAGGLGTRIRPVLNNLPKTLAPINGQSFLSLILKFWLNEGIKNFIICTGYKSNLIEAEVKKLNLKSNIKICKEDQLLGTGGAILNSLSMIKGKNFIVQNGDTFIPLKLQKLLRLSSDKPYVMYMVLIKQILSDRFDVFFLDSNNHVCFNQGSSNLINGGIYIFDKKALLKQNFNLKEVISLEKQIIPKLIRIKKIKGHIFNYPFIDIGIPEDYKKAELFMKENYNV